MARRVKTITIDADGRDKGKRFQITEMSADAGEAWATEAVFALMNTGAELPDGADAGGMAALAVVGIRALGKLPYTAAKPLWDRLLDCVVYLHAPNIPPQPIYKGDACQIEEVATFYTLRFAVLELHLGFSLAGKLPTMDSSPAQVSAAS